MYVEPVAFVWEDGTRYKVDSVIDMRRAASLKAGGVGMRYTVNVRGKETFMFLEEDRWFMEREGRAERDGREERQGRAEPTERAEREERAERGRSAWNA
jgi:hypothetical protein